MTDRGRLGDGERQRLVDCVREPIRAPGAIQNHGVLLGVDAASLTITVASENAPDILGHTVRELLDSELLRVIGRDALGRIAGVLDGSVANPVPVTIGDQHFDAIATRSGDLVLVELEPTPDGPTSQGANALLVESIHRLSAVTTEAELTRVAAVELRALTGFDRVMVYRFHGDGHGEVVAEQRSPDMEAYLGLHYPASDIPAQARQLYLSKRSRSIVRSAPGQTATLVVSDPALAAIDLSAAELRAVSPHHLEFMRNMGQASTLSLSLVHDDRLIGMITCAHRTERRLPYLMRRGLEVLANQLALQLSSMAEIERLRGENARARIRRALLDKIGIADDVTRSLLVGSPSILDLIPAGGASLRIHGKSSSVGAVPPAESIELLVEALLGTDGTLDLVTDAISLTHPDLAGFVPEVAGVLLVPLGGNGDFVAWYRPELAQTVHWLGDMAASNRQSTLSPRDSFSAWAEDVRGMSASWDGLEAEALALCRDLDGAFLRIAQSELAYLALHDALTGLPNRRLLMDRLEHALSKYARGAELSVLFIDLDGFKSVNDSFGHETGDALLAHVGQQILASVRVQDTVARLGGDEFVVLCEDTTAEEADVVAGRVVTALRAPLSIGLPIDAVRVTASVGVISANLSFSASELLREADAAMYRAKQSGRDKASR